MTDEKCKEKYPIGTKIKYISNLHWDDTGDNGKIGTIVNFHLDYPIIFLPESKHVSSFSTPDIPASWETGWDSLKILPVKGQQLIFAFME
jgi:hypothetical protein